MIEENRLITTNLRPHKNAVVQKTMQFQAHKINVMTVRNTSKLLKLVIHCQLEIK